MMQYLNYTYITQFYYRSLELIINLLWTLSILLINFTFNIIKKLIIN